MCNITRPPLSLAAFAATLLWSLSASAGYPAPWPDESAVGGAGQWIPYTYQGSPLADDIGTDDTSTGPASPSQAAELSGGEGSPAQPTSYIAYDPVNEVIFVRMRVLEDPLASGVPKDGSAGTCDSETLDCEPGAGNGPWNNTQWLLTFDIDGDGIQEFALNLFGNSGGGNSSDVQTEVNTIEFDHFGTPMHSGDDLVLYYNSSSPTTQDVTPASISSYALSGAAEAVWIAEATTQVAAGHGLGGGNYEDGFRWDFGTTMASVFTSDPDVVDATANPEVAVGDEDLWGDGWLISFQVPLSAFVDDEGKRLIFPDTPVLVGFSTATSNTNPYQKDIAYPGTFSVDTSKPTVFLDVFIPEEGIVQDPVTLTLDITCETDPTLVADVVDTYSVTDGEAAPSVVSVTFEYALDGVAGPWSPIAEDTDHSDEGSTFNSWSAVFADAEAGTDYYFRVTAVDDQGNTTRRVFPRTFDPAGEGCAPFIGLGSFEDQAFTVPEDTFNQDTTAWFLGAGFVPRAELVVAFYDSSGALVASSPASASSLGDVSVSHDFATDAPLGTWHAAVYPAGVEPLETFVPGHESILVTDEVSVAVAIAANPDDVATAQGDPLVIPVSTLTANDVSVDTATFSLPETQSTEGATLSYDADAGTVTYTPGAGFSGADTFRYRICSVSDSDNCTNVTVNVDVNGAPSQADAEVWVVTGTPSASYDAAADFDDPDGDAFDAAGVDVTSQPQDAVATDPGDGEAEGTIVVVPTDVDAAGVYTVGIVACDDHAEAPACDTATLTVTYNDPPTIVGPSDVVTTETSVGFPIADIEAASDQGSVEAGWDSGSFSVSTTSEGTFGATAASALGGTCAISDGQVVYTAPTGIDSGTDSCWVQACEAQPAADPRACGTAEMTFTLVPAFAPDADDLAGLEGQPIRVTPESLLGNDEGTDDSTFALVGASSTEGGTIALDPDSGEVVYTPADAFSGTDTFSYRVCDVADDQNCSDVTVTVAVNGLATVADTEIWVVTGTADVTVQVVDHFSDADGDSLDPASVSSPATTDGGGVATGSGSVTFTPTDPQAATSYSFDYSACDDDAVPACDSATVTVVYNDPPTVDGHTAIVAEGDTYSLPIDTVVTTSSQGTVEGGWDTTSIAVSTTQDGSFGATSESALGGICAIVGSQIVYSAPDGVTSGTDSCWVRLCETNPGPTGTEASGRACGVAELEFDLTDEFATNDDLLATPQDVAVDTTAQALANNDPGADATSFILGTGSAPGDSETSRTITSTEGGTVVWDIETGDISYTPADGFWGQDSFSYQICAVIEPSDCDTVSVTVNVNGAPQLGDTEIWVAVGTPSVTFVAGDHFSDPDGDGIDPASVDTPDATEGGVITTVDGQTTFTPTDRAAAGSYTFSYEACDDDPAAACDEGNVTVVYNDAPTIDAPPVTVAEGGTRTLSPDTILDASSQGTVEGGWDTGSFTVSTNSDGPFGSSSPSELGGSCTVSDDGVVYSAPEGVASGTDTCWVQLCEAKPGPAGADAAGRACGTTQLSFNLTDQFAPQPDTLVTAQGVPVTTTVTDLAENDPGTEPASFVLGDTAPPGGVAPGEDPITSITTDNGGTVTWIPATGEITYTPAEGFWGTDTFPYQICDGVDGGNCTSVTVTIDVNAAPTQADAEIWVVTGTPSTSYHAVDGFSDPDGDALDNDSVAAEGSPEGGQVSTTGGALTYVPDNPDTPGVVHIDFQACDDDEAPACDDATLTITYNDPPVLVGRTTPVTSEESQSTEISDILDASDQGAVAPGWDATSVSIATSTEGTFGLAADSALGGHCAIVGDAVVYSAPAGVDSGTDSCWVRVCEVAPGPTGTSPEGRACGMAELVFDITPDAELDSDEDGIPDVIEQAIGTDPLDPDSDGDQLLDGEEIAGGDPLTLDAPTDTDPLDADSDDDGLSDGDEVNATGLLQGSEPTDPNDADSDDDGLSDGLEVGVEEPVSGGQSDGETPATFEGTDPEAESFMPDSDPTTTTDPLDADSDDDGLSDGSEDANADGAVTNVIGNTGSEGEGETDPNDSDTDDDGLSDGAELNQWGSDPLDTDTDDGGIPDGTEVAAELDPTSAPDDASIMDSDGDGLSDLVEDKLGTDPNDSDTDGDGLDDFTEVAGGQPGSYEPGLDTDPLDADTDDDGLSDGVETEGSGPLADSGPTDPLDYDSDGDGLADGLEAGVEDPVSEGTSDGGVPFTGTNEAVFTPDADPTSTTDPNDADTDDDGLSDGSEDADGNGRVDNTLGDSESEGQGETDPGTADTDGDGIQDGTELGLVTPETADTDLNRFIPDHDPETTTNPVDIDTDDGGIEDGVEDQDHNGRRDPGETEPAVINDDSVNALILRGGAQGCQGSGGPATPLAVLLVVGLMVARRRRRTLA